MPPSAMPYMACKSTATPSRHPCSRLPASAQAHHPDASLVSRVPLCVPGLQLHPLYSAALPLEGVNKAAQLRASSSTRRLSHDTAAAAAAAARRRCRGERLLAELEPLTSRSYHVDVPAVFVFTYFCFIYILHGPPVSSVQRGGPGCPRGRGRARGPRADDAAEWF